MGSQFETFCTLMQEQGPRTQEVANRKGDGGRRGQRNKGKACLTDIREWTTLSLTAAHDE